jgi:predicted nucleic acid-binding protein
LAAFDSDDAQHAPCVSLLASIRGARIVPAPVLVEFDYMASRELGAGAFRMMLDEVHRGAYEIADLTAADYQRVGQILATYADLRVGFVDAAVLAIVERLREPKLATLDHRHFSVMRPRHVDALELLPA